MSSGKSKSTDAPSLNLNTLLALVTLAGSAWFVSQKLTSDRPIAQTGGPRQFFGEQTLEARLWEDPFKPRDRAGQQAAATTETNLSSLIEQIRQRTQPTHRVLILPVMVPGGHYGEDQESRIRSRFAIISGLSASGYAPVDAEHLGVVTIPWPTQLELSKVIGSGHGAEWWEDGDPFGTNCPPQPGCPLGIATSFRMDVYYEWYRPRVFFPGSQTNSAGTDVLVLWLDDSFFEDEPILRLPLLLHPLREDNDQVSVSLIGPRRSSTLRAMLPGDAGGAVGVLLWQRENPELAQQATAGLQGIELFSATASAMDEVLVSRCSGSPRQAVGKVLTDHGFKTVHNFVATDAELAGELLDELGLRNSDVVTNRANHLVLISEWDTFYARMLSLTYGAEMAVRQSTNGMTRQQFVQAYVQGKKGLPSNFHSLLYLRGLDGQTVGASTENGSSTDTPRKAPTTSFEELQRWTPDANKAAGQAQFDYLARLGDQLEELHARLRRQNRRARIAVGIVGSDVYDTLLILQALRGRFPNALFFTTDLDARFSHPQERGWARNLLVVSGYGLKLDPELQGPIAPFRDSTQTAQFTATLAALGNTNLQHLTRIPPRRFEIGNNGPIDLSVASNRVSSSMATTNASNRIRLHPPTSSEIHEGHNLPGNRLLLLLQHLGRRSEGSAGATPEGALLLVLLGLGLVLGLGCAFWSPLRARTLGMFGFTGEVLPYCACDLGGPDQISALLTQVEKQPNRLDALGTCIGEEWQKHKPADPRLPADPAASTKALSTWQAQRAHIFVECLNRVLATFRNETFPRSRWESRRLLDGALDTMGANINPDEGLVAAGSARVAARKLFKLRCANVSAWWLGGLLVMAVSAFLAADIWHDAFHNPAGEPFSLSNGISAWPAIILRWGAAILSVLFCLTLYSQLRVMFYELTRSYRFPLDGNGGPSRWSRVLHFFRHLRSHIQPFHGAEPEPDGRIAAATLWCSYRQAGHWVGRCLRAGVACLVYYYLAGVIFQLFGLTFQPLRGETVQGWTKLQFAGWTIPWYAVVNLTFFSLTFLAIDAARLCQQFIRRLSAGNVYFSDTTRAHFRRYRGDISGEFLDDWIGTRLIADLTENVGRSLWFPAIVLLVLLSARLSFWDHWPWHTAHIIIMTLNFVVALASVVILQQAARAAKAEAEGRLQAKVRNLQARTAPTPLDNDAAQAANLLDEIQNIRRGAFASIWENPVLGALLVGPGGLTILQMLVWFVQR